MTEKRRGTLNQLELFGEAAALLVPPRTARVAKRETSSDARAATAAQTSNAGKTSADQRIASRPQKARGHPPAGGHLLDVIAAADYLGLSVSTLNKMRCAGGGPAFLKITRAAVRYDPKDLDSWIELRRRRSTSDQQH